MSEVIFSFFFPGVFLFLGVVFLLLGIGMKISWNRKERVCTQPCNATIVDVQREVSRSADDSYMESWYPVYEYYANGTTIQRRSSVGRRKNDFIIGSRVTLYLNPEKPREYFCPEEKTGLILRIFIGVGCLLLAAGITSLFLLW